MNRTTAARIPLTHPSVPGAIRRANIDPTGMTDTQLRSALMASIATDNLEPAESSTALDRIIDKMDDFLFGPALIKALMIFGGSTLLLVIISQSIIAIANGTGAW